MLEFLSSDWAIYILGFFAHKIIWRTHGCAMGTVRTRRPRGVAHVVLDFQFVRLGIVSGVRINSSGCSHSTRPNHFILHLHSQPAIETRME